MKYKSIMEWCVIRAVLQFPFRGLNTNIKTLMKGRTVLGHDYGIHPYFWILTTDFIFEHNSYCHFFLLEWQPLYLCSAVLFWRHWNLYTQQMYNLPITKYLPFIAFLSDIYLWRYKSKILVSDDKERIDEWLVQYLHLHFFH